MAQFRVVQIFSPRELLEEAVRLGCDDNFTSLPLGVLVDSLDEQQVEVRKLTDASRIVFAVYDGPALM